MCRARDDAWAMQSDAYYMNTIALYDILFSKALSGDPPSGKVRIGLQPNSERGFGHILENSVRKLVKCACCAMMTCEWNHLINVCKYVCSTRVAYLLQSYRAETMHGAYKTFVSQTNDISFPENPDLGDENIKGVCYLCYQHQTS